MLVKITFAIILLSAAAAMIDIRNIQTFDSDILQKQTCSLQILASYLATSHYHVC